MIEDPTPEEVHFIGKMFMAGDAGGTNCDSYVCFENRFKKWGVGIYYLK